MEILLAASHFAPNYGGERGARQNPSTDGDYKRESGITRDSASA